MRSSSLFAGEDSPRKSPSGSRVASWTSAAIRSSMTALALSRLSELAAVHQLSVYDAAYLELAQRRRLVLGCKDGLLRTAAKKAGVSLWE